MDVGVDAVVEVELVGVRDVVVAGTEVEEAEVLGGVVAEVELDEPLLPHAASATVAPIATATFRAICTPASVRFSGPVISLISATARVQQIPRFRF